ncbi:MAG: methyltransferase [Myxococcota bacterium]|nr:methyltransferase [Myxococcota bacterium]
MDTSGFTQDALLRGELSLWQPARGQGYRFNLDPVLLSGFSRPRGRVLELGAGCGVLGLLLLKRGRAEQVTFVERQPALAALCERNLKENGFADRGRVICGDLRELTLEAHEGVVFNPPYFAANSGRPSSGVGRDEARFERHGTLRDFVEVSFGVTRAGGSVDVVLRAERFAELGELAKELGGGVVRARPVIARSGDASRHYLVELSGQASDGVEELPPLILHRGAEREFSDEVKELLGE